jgi:hypothetical protein
MSDSTSCCAAMASAIAAKGTGVNEPSVSTTHAGRQPPSVVWRREMPRVAMRREEGSCSPVSWLSRKVLPQLYKPSTPTLTMSEVSSNAQPAA